jgi:CBS domain containing-hemolysin-like protein
MIGSILGILCFLCLQGFFSGTEIALVSCNRIRIHHLAQRGSWRARLVQRLKAHPERMLSTTLVAVNISIVVQSILAHRLAEQLSPSWSVIVSTLIMWPLVLLCGEILPMSFFHHYADRAALLTVIPLRIGYLILFPLVLFFSQIARLVSRITRVKNRETERLLSREELQMLVSGAGGLLALPVEDRRIIQRVFQFKQVRAESIMVPIHQVRAATLNATVDEVRRLVLESGHSRIPLYDGEPGRISRFVRAVDLVGKGPDEAAAAFSVAALVVGRSEAISEILQSFQSVGRHLAVVVDRSGRALGILTLEDVVEEIVGEIEDEYDKR